MTTAATDAMPMLTAAQASAAQAAIKGASSDVASAISRLVALGNAAPVCVRHALGSLGHAFANLGESDPTLPYSAHGPDEHPHDRPYDRPY